jgi:hypothetical protein
VTPEEHYISVMNALERPGDEQQAFVAEFRRSLIQHDTRVLEDFLYGSEGADDTSTCSGCGEEHPTDELDSEWCEACLRVGGST